MNISLEAGIFVLFSFLLLWDFSGGREVKNLGCQVCRAVVDETLFRISIVDPKKTVEVGSFRVDSHGNQARYEVPYAGSETHLTELFEEICTHMHNYGEITDSQGQRGIVRMTSKQQEPLNIMGIEIDANKQRKYVSICDDLLSEYDEDMMVVFKKTDVPQYLAEEKVCADISGLCTLAELKLPMPVPVLKEEEKRDEVMEELEKRLKETDPITADPTREESDGQADGQTDTVTDAPQESTDKTEL